MVMNHMSVNDHALNEEIVPNNIFSFQQTNKRRTQQTGLYPLSL